ncbi:MAG: MraY family glycosyltransferase [Thermodesulfovibrionales bacterium]
MLSFAITVSLLPRLAGIASRAGLMDAPGRRKVHDEPVPTVGGIGIVTALCASFAIFTPPSYLMGYLAGLLLLFVVGLADDMLDISSRFKFAAQMAASLLMIYVSNAAIWSFGDLLALGPFVTGPLAAPLTVFCTIGVINAVNMADGLDGLAGGQSLIALVTFSLLAYLSGRPELALLSLALVGGIIGFLRYNWHPATLFLGDAGSLSLGFSLAFLSVALTQTGSVHVSPVVPLLILALPITDCVTVMLKRISKKRGPFYADRTHLHHVLLKFGMQKKSAVLAILCASAAFSAIALAGAVYRVPDYYLFLFFSVFFVAYLSASFNLVAIYRFVERRRKSGRPSETRAAG